MDKSNKPDGEPQPAPKIDPPDKAALVEVDGSVPAAVLDRVQMIPGVRQAKALAF